jgi:hypothetical protein
VIALVYLDALVERFLAFIYPGLTVAVALRAHSASATARAAGASCAAAAGASRAAAATARWVCGVVTATKHPQGASQQRDYK